MTDFRDGFGQRHIGQAAATVESILANPFHSFGNRNGAEVAAKAEGILANAFHAGRDDNGGQTALTVEGVAANACHSIGLAVEFHRLRDDDVARIGSGGHLGDVFGLREVVGDAVNLYTLGNSIDACKQTKAQENVSQVIVFHAGFIV